MKIISAKSGGYTFESFKGGDVFRKADGHIYMKTEELISEKRRVNCIRVTSGLLAWTGGDERCHPIATVTLTKEE